MFETNRLKRDSYSKQKYFIRSLSYPQKCIYLLIFFNYPYSEIVL